MLGITHCAFGSLQTFTEQISEVGDWLSTPLTSFEALDAWDANPGIPIGFPTGVLSMVTYLPAAQYKTNGEQIIEED